MATTILLVESKTAGSKSLAPALAKSDLLVVVANTGSEALHMVKNRQPVLAIIDASTMRSNGVRISRRIRAIFGECPIIHCRNQATPIDRTAEADVYLSQPFTARKVLNRIRILLPVDRLKEEIVRAGGITYYPSKRSVDVCGRGEKKMTPKLAKLLEQFLLHPNEVLEREYLMRHVWDTDYFGDTRTLDVHMRWMRELLETNPARPKLIRTIRSVGYIFNIQSEQTTNL